LSDFLKLVVTRRQRSYNFPEEGGLVFPLTKLFNENSLKSAQEYIDFVILCLHYATFDNEKLRKMLQNMDEKLI
jgi:hypothetical protein